MPIQHLSTTISAPTTIMYIYAHTTPQYHYLSNYYHDAHLCPYNISVPLVQYRTCCSLLLSYTSRVPYPSSEPHPFPSCATVPRHTTHHASAVPHTALPHSHSLRDLSSAYRIAIPTPCTSPAASYALRRTLRYATTTRGAGFCTLGSSSFLTVRARSAVPCASSVPDTAPRVYVLKKLGSICPRTVDRPERARHARREAASLSVAKRRLAITNAPAPARTPH
eukprot:1005998-Rhodomonas_salina.1